MFRVEEGLSGGVEGQVENRVELSDKVFPQVQSGRVEFKILYEAGLQRVNLVRRALLRVEGVPGIEGPAPRGRVFRRAGAFGNILPEALQVRSAREYPACADYGYRLLFVSYQTAAPVSVFLRKAALRALSTVDS